MLSPRSLAELECFYVELDKELVVSLFDLTSSWRTLTSTQWQGIQTDSVFASPSLSDASAGTNGGHGQMAPAAPSKRDPDANEGVMTSKRQKVV